MNKAIVTLLICLMCTASYGQDVVEDSSVKAAFIYHFINFIDWEDQATEYDICVPDNETLETGIRQSLKNKTVKNRNLNIVNRRENCHILISDQQELASDKTLTIGLLSKDAMMEFRIIEDRLKFAINLDRIKKSKLKISSQLLKLAIIDKD